MNQSFLASWFRGIRGKLLFAAVLPMLGFGILGTAAYNGINQLIHLLNVANDQVIPTFDVVGEMRQARNKFGYQILNAMNAAEDPKLFKERLTLAREGLVEFRKAHDIYDPVPRTKEEDISYNEVKPYFDGYYKTMNDILVLVESGNPEKFNEAKHLLATQFEEIGGKVRKWNKEVQTIYSNLAKQGVKEAEETKASVTNLIALVTLLSSLLIFSILLWIAVRITSSVSSISGRLTQAGGQVTSAVEQLNEAGNGLSQSSTEAAASLEETVASLEEMTSMVQMNSDNAKQAATLSIDSRESAERGELEIQKLIKAMSNISNSSKQIEEIISVIDDIAFQTNLLALNAAVEAARAGEQGKGFAVVADAVRSLAQRSASAAKDITALIKESVAQVEEGSRYADQSGTVLHNITSSVKKVSDLNSEIATASSEQATGIQQITKAMNQLDQAVQSNASSAEEIAATSGEISNLAITSQNLTIELNAVIFGQNGSDIAATLPDSQSSRTVTTPNRNATGASHPSNVIDFKGAFKKATKTSVASKAIPFDEDERGKVGTTDDF